MQSWCGFPGGGAIVLLLDTATDSTLAGVGLMESMTCARADASVVRRPAKRLRRTALGYPETQ
jgi:hypothetical protein